MNLDQMIEVLQAAKRGEEIEVLNSAGWVICVNPEFSFPMDRYRVAPKEMTLVEELRGDYVSSVLQKRAADRIEELESYAKNWSINNVTTDELIEEIRTRMLDKC